MKVYQIIKILIIDQFIKVNYLFIKGDLRQICLEENLNNC